LEGDTRMVRITRWNAYGLEVTHDDREWHEHDCEVCEPSDGSDRIGVRRAGQREWIVLRLTVPQIVRWWFTGETQER
jgi:hypothetical protein